MGRSPFEADKRTKHSMRNPKRAQRADTLTIEAGGVDPAVEPGVTRRVVCWWPPPRAGTAV